MSLDCEVVLDEEGDILELSKTYRQTLSQQVKAYKQDLRNQSCPVIQELTASQREIMDKKCEELSRQRGDIKAVLARLIALNVAKDAPVNQQKQQQQQQNGSQHSAPKTQSQPQLVQPQQKQKQPQPPPVTQTPIVVVEEKPKPSRFRPIFNEDGYDERAISANSSGKNKGKGPMHSDDDDEEDDVRQEEELLKPTFQLQNVHLSLMVDIKIFSPLKWTAVFGFFSGLEKTEESEINSWPLSRYMYFVAALLVFYKETLGTTSLKELASGTMKKPIKLDSAGKCVACVNSQFGNTYTDINSPMVKPSVQRLVISRGNDLPDAVMDVCSEHGLLFTFWKTILEMSRLDNPNNGKKIISLCGRMAVNLNNIIIKRNITSIHPKDWRESLWLPENVCLHLREYLLSLDDKTKQPQQPKATNDSSSSSSSIGERPEAKLKHQPPLKRQKRMEIEDDEDDDIAM